MPRYLASLDYADGGDIYGSIVTVDAPSGSDAFDVLLAQLDGSANILILGTCEEVRDLALDRSLEQHADYKAGE